MTAGRLFLLALCSPGITMEESIELRDWIWENADMWSDDLENLKMSRLDLDEMEKDFISLNGTRIC